MSVASKAFHDQFGEIHQDNAVNDSERLVKLWGNEMSIVRDFTLFVLVEKTQQYWLKCSNEIKSSPCYRGKIKKLVNMIGMYVNNMMCQIKMTDTSYTKNACANFPCYTKDFIDDGYCLSFEMQYGFNESNKTLIRELEDEIQYRLSHIGKDENLLKVLFLSISYCKAATDTVTEVNKIKRQKFREHDGLKYTRYELPFLDVCFGTMCNLFNQFTSKNVDTTRVNEIVFKLQDKLADEIVDNYAKFLERLTMRYTEYCIAMIVLTLRNKQQLQPFVLECIKENLGSDITILELERECKKIRVGLKDDDVVEFAKKVNKAKNTPILDKMREKITGNYMWQRL